MKRRDAVLVFGLFSLVACLERKKGNPDGATGPDAPVADVAVPRGTGGAQGSDGATIPDPQQPADASSATDLPITISDSEGKPDGALVGSGGAGDSGGKGGTGEGGNGAGRGGGGGVASGSGGRTGLGGSLVTGTGGSSGSGGTTVASPLNNGSPCTVGTACASAVCVDGVCCNNTCSGCNACTRALTGQADGLCAPVPAGNDPHNTCTDETVSNQCGNDGACDGNGACRKVATSHQCSAATCVGTTFTPASYCNGTGACGSASPQDCGMNKTCNSSNQCVCASGTCGSGCVTCGFGTHCSSGTCVCDNTNSSCGGTSCQSCTGTSKPYCLADNGTCVQCTQSSQCTDAGYQTCASNKCICRQQSTSTNVLTNAGFDTSANGWTLVGGAAWDGAADADDCPASGSMALTSVGHEITQCLPAQPDTYYSFGFKFKGIGAFCAMIFYADTSCSTPSATSNIRYTAPGSDGTTWIQGAASAYSTSDAHSVILDCNGQGGSGHYDQLYLSSTNATF